MRKASMKIIAGMALWLTVGTAGASIITNTAIGSTSVTNPATWSVAVPVAGDAAVWATGNKSVWAPSATFYGSNLLIQTSGSLRSGATGQNSTLQNITLDGGRIYNGNTGTLSLNFNTLTLNSGAINGGAGARPMTLKSGALAGSGTIVISNESTTATNLVSFNTALGSVTTTNFTGLFSVASGGELGFSGGTTAATFGIEVASGGFLLLTDGTDTKVTSLTLGGVAKTAGTYSVADLGAYSFSPTGTGTITVGTPKAKEKLSLIIFSSL